MKGHVSLKHTEVRPLELINVPAEYPLETEDLPWKAQLEGVSLEKHNWETCCEEEKLNIHEQPGFERLFLSLSLRFLWGQPQCLSQGTAPHQGGNSFIFVIHFYRKKHCSLLVSFYAFCMHLVTLFIISPFDCIM